MKKEVKKIVKYLLGIKRNSNHKLFGDYNSYLLTIYRTSARVVHSYPYLAENLAEADKFMQRLERRNKR